MSREIYLLEYEVSSQTKNRVFQNYGYYADIQSIEDAKNELRDLLGIRTGFGKWRVSKVILDEWKPGQVISENCY